MEGEAYFLDLYNDSDRPESELHLVRVNDKSYTGKVRVLWDFSQIFEIKCTKQ